MTSDSEVGRGQGSEVCGGVVVVVVVVVVWPGIQTTNIGRGTHQVGSTTTARYLQVPVSTELDSEPATATISPSLPHSNTSPGGLRSLGSTPGLLLQFY